MHTGEFEKEGFSVWFIKPEDMNNKAEQAKKGNMIVKCKVCLRHNTCTLFCIYTLIHRFWNFCLPVAGILCSLEPRFGTERRDQGWNVTGLHQQHAHVSTEHQVVSQDSEGYGEWHVSHELLY